MGITGLLPILKPIQNPVSLEEYRGKTLAVDTYAWLHKGVFSCSMQLALNQPTQAYINYIMKKIRMLNHFGITPYMVLDGDALPRKKGTEIERAQRREHHKKMALEAYDKKNNKLAMSHFQKACDVTPEMAKAVIEHFKIHNVKFVVAPYEADSQMVYLEKAGLVDGIISEDSDLLIFGAQTLLTKLKDDATCIEIKRQNFKLIKSPQVHAFTQDQWMLVSILSGCDYSKGIPGVGMQKSITMVKKYQTLKRVLMAIRFEGKISIPSTFEDEYNKATIAFRYPIVFDPITLTPRHLNDVPEDDEKLKDQEYLYSCTGSLWDLEIHQKVANGDLNPFSKLPLISREITAISAKRPAMRTYSEVVKKPTGSNQHDIGSQMASASASATRSRSLPYNHTNKPEIPPSLVSLRKPLGSTRSYTPRKRVLNTLDSFIKQAHSSKVTGKSTTNKSMTTNGIPVSSTTSGNSNTINSSYSSRKSSFASPALMKIVKKTPIERRKNMLYGSTSDTTIQRTDRITTTSKFFRMFQTPHNTTKTTATMNPPVGTPGNDAATVEEIQSQSEFQPQSQSQSQSETTLVNTETQQQQEQEQEQKQQSELHSSPRRPQPPQYSHVLVSSPIKSSDTEDPNCDDEEQLQIDNSMIHEDDDFNTSGIEDSLIQDDDDDDDDDDPNHKYDIEIPLHSEDSLVQEDDDDDDDNDNVGFLNSRGSISNEDDKLTQEFKKQIQSEFSKKLQRSLIKSRFGHGCSTSTSTSTVTATATGSGVPTGFQNLGKKVSKNQHGAREPLTLLSSNVVTRSNSKVAGKGRIAKKVGGKCAVDAVDAGRRRLGGGTGGVTGFSAKQKTIKATFGYSG
ncbi:unnamed protein product [Ambrosiozyma monospora]|uniref:Unnamed protein product n=1 Tax=Ambrosiozyma monospora TaxID=43982 RepID=A0A9W6YWA9_AMBMO|nr:unnamed protein product [Ambrosiozyma monospora]